MPTKTRATIRKAPPVKYTSDFALLELKSGRATLARLTGPAGYGKDGSDIRIPVTIKGFITFRYGPDDGNSIEYGVEVKTIKIAVS